MAIRTQEFNKLRPVIVPSIHVGSLNRDFTGDWMTDSPSAPFTLLASGCNQPSLCPSVQTMFRTPLDISSKPCCHRCAVCQFMLTSRPTIYFGVPSQGLFTDNAEPDWS